ncbi:MAG TPA: kelch repeat-containing protein [Candidatus Limnocylindria bacterium]|nr:kelch repeat-containing protein [Candidatus Limnocylindria bacterium]
MTPVQGRFRPWSLFVLFLLGCFSAGAVGTWRPVTRSAPGPVSLMLLLSDGTVMAADSDTSSAWYRLTPDIHGNYANGTWTRLASMHDTRLYYSSCMLRDGRVFVAGGEYGTGGAKSEIYNPLSNLWTQITVPKSLLDPSKDSPEVGEKQGFYDSPCKILPNGNVLVAPVGAIVTGGSLVYNVLSGSWTSGPKFFRVGYPDQAEASWVKLPDDSILTIDPGSLHSERYIPSLNRWVNDANVPVSIYDEIGTEIGAAVLLPDGRAMFFGGTGQTVFYTPSGTTAAGHWAVGPDIPDGLVAADAPAALLPNGKVLCAFSPSLYKDENGDVQYPGPTTFYEFDPVTNEFTVTRAPTGLVADYASYEACMLALPNGTILYSSFDAVVRIYQPDGAPLAAGKPAITGLAQNTDGSYHLTGTLLNGISEGAAYGDDAQMDSNYPLVRLSNAAGNVYYARTFNWSSTGVRTGDNPATTEFTLPKSLPPVGTYSLVVVANGISSEPITLSLPLALQITATAERGQTVLSWPALPDNAGLETLADLALDTWVPVTNGVSLVGNSLVLTNAFSSDRAFFRLKLH